MQPERALELRYIPEGIDKVPIEPLNEQSGAMPLTCFSLYEDGIVYEDWLAVALMPVMYPLPSSVSSTTSAAVTGITMKSTRRVAMSILSTFFISLSFLK